MSNPAANSITVTALQLISAALQEIGVLAGGEQPSTDDEAWVLQKLQRLIDRYNARETMIYSSSFQQFTLVPNLAPHTIGPGNTATFGVNQRPVDIESIGLILTQGATQPYTEVALNKRDKDWWAGQAIKGLTSTLPTEFYYEPDWPLGNIFFWPVPLAANGVNIQLRAIIAQITTYNAQFSMPPAYWDAIVYPLAETLCPSFNRTASADLLRLKGEAIKAIQVNNIKSPRMASDSPSQTSGNGQRTDFNFLTGLSR